LNAALAAEGCDVNPSALFLFSRSLHPEAVCRAEDTADPSAALGMTKLRAATYLKFVRGIEKKSL
jgi:hypothetical protein